MAIEKTVNFTLEVLAPEGIFLSITPLSAKVRQGHLAIFDIVANGENDYTGNIYLSVTGLPSGVAFSLTPAVIATSGTSTLTIDTSAVEVGQILNLTLIASNVQ